MTTKLRVLLCVARPPFHHAWEVLERVDEQCEAPAIGATWADPTQERFRGFRMRCTRCGSETWWPGSDAATWGRYTHF